MYVYIKDELNHRLCVLLAVKIACCLSWGVIKSTGGQGKNNPDPRIYSESSNVVKSINSIPSYTCGSKTAPYTAHQRDKSAAVYGHNDIDECENTLSEQARCFSWRLHMLANVVAYTVLAHIYTPSSCTLRI